MLIPLVYAFSVSGLITADSKYPGLFNGSLKLSIPDSLPVGELLIAGNIKITQAQLDSEIKKASTSLQPQLKDNLFFFLENIAVDRLLNAEVHAWAVSKKLDTKNMKDQDVIKKFIGELTANITVSADEVKEAYESNSEVFKGAKYSDVEPYIKSQLINEKKQEFIEKHVNEIGKRVVIKINDSWAKSQYPKAINNIVDKLRRSGKPSIVDFGASGCGPCDMMTPILEQLKKEYSGIMNIEFVDVREYQILGARYGVSSIPVQVFFDKNGKEFYRHVGFFPKNNILAKFKEMGVSK
jgi:thioredoxin 1